MDRQSFSILGEYFGMVHSITVRAVAAFTDHDLEFRPKPEMRTARELIFHIYSQEKILAEAARQGKFTTEAATRSSPEAPAGAAKLQTLVTVNDLTNYAQQCHQAAQAIFSGMSEAELNRSVESPFGTYPAWRYFSFAADEHWHHRGQIYVYLRLLDRQPPMLYDF